MKNMINLKGKTALITGAANGNGLAIQKAFSKAGAKVLPLEQEDKKDVYEYDEEDDGKKRWGFLLLT